MKKTLWTFGIAGLALAAMLILPTAGYSHHDPVPESAVKWDYKTFTLPVTEVGNQEHDLNYYGDEGWELVSSVLAPSDKVIFYLKRPK